MLAGLATLAVLVGVPLAMLRLVRVAAGHRRFSLTAATAFVSAWVLCFATGVQAVQGAPVASTSAASLTVDEVQLVRADLADLREFSGEIDTDPYAERAAADPQALVSGLAGKDVLLVFVESYGRVAVQDTSYSEGITQVLDQGTQELAAAGYHVAERLPHLADVRRRQLAGALQPAVRALGRQRAPLPAAARRGPADPDRACSGRPAGGPSSTSRPTPRTGPRARTSTTSSSTTTPATSATQGPKFGYAPMPDQYTLEDFRRRELAPADRPPVMAEIDLISSHHPWTPLPHMVPWDQVGDGSVFDGMPEQGQTLGGGLPGPRGGQAGLRRVRRVLLAGAHVVPDDLRRPEPRPGRPRRPPAAQLRQR